MTIVEGTCQDQVAESASLRYSVCFGEEKRKRNREEEERKDKGSCDAKSQNHVVAKYHQQLFDHC